MGLAELADEWRDEDCKHTWAQKHERRDEPAELICAEELAPYVAKLEELQERSLRQKNQQIQPGMNREEYWRGFAAACGEKAAELDAILDGQPVASGSKESEGEKRG